MFLIQFRISTPTTASAWHLSKDLSPWCLRWVGKKVATRTSRMYIWLKATILLGNASAMLKADWISAEDETTSDKEENILKALMQKAPNCWCSGFFILKLIRLLKTFASQGKIKSFFFPKTFPLVMQIFSSFHSNSLESFWELRKNSLDMFEEEIKKGHSSLTAWWISQDFFVVDGKVFSAFSKGNFILNVQNMVMRRSWIEFSWGNGVRKVLQNVKFC